MNKNELTESVVSWKQKKPSATSFYTSSLCTALLKKPSVLGTTRFADFKRNKRTTGKKKNTKHTHTSPWGEITSCCSTGWEKVIPLKHKRKKNDLFTLKVIKQRNGLLREVTESLNLEKFKTRMSQTSALSLSGSK